ncbi:MAG: hypothetical protein ABIH66_12870 [bacterium]
MDTSDVIRELREKTQGKHSLRIAGDDELAEAVFEHFGGWRDALEAAGLHPKTRLVGYWNHAEVIKRLRQLNGRGESLNTLNLEHNHPRLWNAARRFFGTIEKSIEAAGYRYSDIRKRDEWSEEKIVEEIRSLHDSKIDLSQVSVAEVNSKLLAAGQKFFGSWSRAVEGAGIDYQKVRKRHRLNKRRKKNLEEYSKKRRVYVVRNGVPVEFKKPPIH